MRYFSSYAHVCLFVSFFHLLMLFSRVFSWKVLKGVVFEMGNLGNMLNLEELQIWTGNFDLGCLQWRFFRNVTVVCMCCWF